MIGRWCRQLHSSRPQALGAFKSRKLGTPLLSPAIVDSTISSCPSHALALSFFIWCSRQPNYFHPPRSFDLMVPLVLSLTGRLGSVSAVVDQLESIGCPRKPRNFMILLRIYCRGGVHGTALEVFDEMRSRGFVPNTFARNMVLDVLLKVGRLDVAMRFCRDTPSPNFLSFNILLHGLCKRGDWLGACSVLREMARRRFRPNVGSFLVAMDCFRRARRVMVLLQLLGFMIVSGEQLSLMVWTVLVDSLCRIGRVDLAGGFLRKMVDDGCSPSVVTYTAIIKGLFEADMIEEAFRVFETMLSKGCEADLVLYNVLINSLSKAGRYDDAIGVFFLLRERRMKPDSYTLSSMISVLCISGNKSLLPKLLLGLDVSHDLVACNSLLNFLCKAGYPSRAVEFYSEMIYKGINPDSYTYVGLLSSLCKVGRVDHAVNAYRAIVASDPHIDPFVHTALLDGLVKRGMHHTAIMVFMEALTANHRLDVVSFTTVIYVLFKNGGFHDACSLFNQMKQLGVVPNIYTFNVMLHGLCKAKEINAVRNLLKDMWVAGIELDCISFNTIIGLMLKLNRVRPAVYLFMEMCDLGMKPHRGTRLQLLYYFHIYDDSVNDENTISLVSADPDVRNDLPLCSGE